MAQVAQCDRCSSVVSLYRIAYVEVRGSDCGPRRLYRDLCPGCARDHETWLNTPPAALGQGAPIVADRIVNEDPPVRPAWLGGPLRGHEVTPIGLADVPAVASAVPAGA